MSSFHVEPESLSAGTGPTAYRDPGCPESLLLSLETMGQTMPLLVARRSEDLVLVSGHRRCHGLLTLGWNRVGVRTVEAATDLDALKVSVLENSTCSGFNDLERARIIYRLLDVYSLDASDVALDWLPLLGLSPTTKLLDPYAFLGREEALHEGLRTGVIAPGLARPLSRFKREDFEFLVRILEHPSLSYTQKKELLYLLDELGRRGAPMTRELVKNKRGNELLVELRRARFPEKEKRRDRLEDLKRRTPGWLSFRPTQTEGLEVRLVFRGSDELSQRAQELLDIAGDPEIKDVIETF